MGCDNKTVNQRILAYLKRGYDFTANQARTRFGITNVTARISELRKAGYPIYLNTKTTANGEQIKLYRLGTPRRLQLAAGAMFLSDPRFAKFRQQVEENLALVS